MKHLFYCIAGVFLAIQLDTPFYTACILSLSLLYIVITQREYENISHLCLGIFLLVWLNEFLFLFVPTKSIEGVPNVWINNGIYLTHVFLDTLTFAFLMFRASISRKLNQHRGLPTKGIHMTYADMGLMTATFLFLVVDLTATLENLIRNLEHIGFSEEFAKQYWSWDWMYYNYSDIKRILMGIQILVVWSTVTHIARKEFKYKA